MKKLTFAFLLVLAGLQAQAQAYLGASTSNYAGALGNLVNPASFVDGRYKMDLALPALNLFTYQNFGSFNADAMRAQQGGQGNWWHTSLTDTAVLNSWAYPSATFIDRLIVRNYSPSSAAELGANINFRLDLFNLAFHISEKQSLGFYANLRSITNVDNMNAKLAVLSEEGLEYPALWNQQLNEALVNVNHLTWSEIGFNYSQVLIDNKEHFLKIGISPKVLLGFASAYVHTQDFSYNLINEDSSQYLAGTFDYGYSKEVGDFITAGVNGQIDNTNISDYLKPGSVGIGLDLGAIYEWRPNYAKYKYDMDGKTDLWMRNENKYKARIGLSILDMGGMKFTKGGLSRNFVVNSSALFDLRRFDSATDLETFDMVVDSLINESTAANNTEWVALQDPTQSYRMRTPTAMSLQLDFHIWNYFYLNATAMVNMIPKNKDTKVNVASQFSLTPSFDSPYFGLYLPIAYNQYSGLRGGLATRIGPVILGLNDLNLIRAQNQISGVDFYVGTRLPILYHRVKDKDKDKVSDKMDACKNEPGVWAFLGCPDTDGDGIADSEDACPTVAGVAALNGCPDKDGDGITDAEDACPDNAGPKENQGCPDKDGDGLFDFIDDCPEIAGPKENQGCPWPDSDADGLLDKDDECPNLAGPIENQGCPYKDSDNDGLLDKDDDCPNTPGPKSNKGCPVIEQEVIEVLKTAFDNLEFETNKDIIFESSKPSLTELAVVLKKKTTWKLEIAGHTDNVGDDNLNLVLSKKRAEALKAYLISEGVEETRLITRYFGETQPLASNDTPEGRQKNRRVEMKIVLE